LHREQHPILLELEINAIGIVGEDWSVKLNKNFLKHAEKRREYKKDLVRELLRLVRNQVRVLPQLMHARALLSSSLSFTSPSSDTPIVFVHSV